MDYAQQYAGQPLYEYPPAYGYPQQNADAQQGADAQQYAYPQYAYPQQYAYPPQHENPWQYAAAPQYVYAPQYAAVPQYAGPAQPAPGFWNAPESTDMDPFGWNTPGEAAAPEIPNAWEVLPAAEAAGTTAGKSRKLLQLASDILFWVVCITLVAGSVLFSVSKDPRKSYFGYRTYSVKTESMTPRADGTSPPGGFRKGDMIIVKMCRPEEIKTGDIITFNPSVREEDNEMFLTHRVADIKTELGGKAGIFFVTRGDFNNSDDPPISSDMLIGKKVFGVPKAGAFLQKVRENFALALTTIISFFACIIMFRWYFSGTKKKTQPL